MEGVKGLVSVGIPAYNRPADLRRILTVALAQTYTNLEIIVADDASPDPKVRETAEEFAARDPRIIFYRQERNHGVLGNAESVLKAAKGEYFTWFSEDDWRSPDFIQALVAGLEQHPEINFAFCDYYEVDPEGRRLPGYPATHLEGFKPFTSKSRLVRVLSYFLQDAAKGRQNIFYSVFRRQALRELDMREISGNFTHLNMDDIMMFRMLQGGPLLTVPGAMCTLTCGNKKFYAIGAGGGRSPLRTLVALWKEHWKCARVFCRNTGSAVERALIYALVVPRFVFIMAAYAIGKLK